MPPGDLRLKIHPKHLPPLTRSRTASTATTSSMSTCSYCDMSSSQQLREHAKRKEWSFSMRIIEMAKTKLNILSQRAEEEIVDHMNFMIDRVGMSSRKGRRCSSNEAFSFNSSGLLLRPADENSLPPSLLHLLCQLRAPCVPLIEALLDLFPDDVYVSDSLGRLPLHYVCDQPKSEEMCAIILRLLQANPRGASQSESTGMYLPLHLACQGKWSSDYNSPLEEHLLDT
eukprot:CAMPEP_0194373070 /NCGR_PEP_ID=MMETSP0174-20130528/21495_1 /TAXON_ID=216777 /ORGANISM="Proboscia alata, Strain PI-D3" /LENGTH=227 /DNA_ID=CAMNT_0039151941 /DNA_START=45 /DNA_END=725 /DNA_ORIENTATION=+